MKIDFENISGKYLYSLIVIFAAIPVLIFAGTPPFADDYSWLNFMESMEYNSIREFFTSAGPFGFYRPLFIILMKIMFVFFGGYYLPYRVLAAILNVFTALVIYRILHPRFYSRTVSFFSAVLFSVLAVHSEVLFIANCLNILIADLLILAGIYCFSNNGKISNYILSAVLFTFSLMFRESSVYYIPLLLVFYYFLKKRNMKKLMITSVFPIALYGALLIVAHPADYGNFYHKVGGVDLSITGFLYKSFHFMLISFFPLKFVFYFFGFEYYDTLRSLISGGENRTLFLIIASFAGLFVSAVLFFVIRKLKSGIIFPLLIFLSTVAVYLAGYHVAERFVFLAALGTSVISVLFIIGFRSKKLSYVILVLFLLLHLSTLLLRGNSYENYSDNFITSLRELHSKVQNDTSESNILVHNLPVPVYGQVLISALNYNDAYKYYYPNSKKTFYLMNCLSNEEKQLPFTQTFRFNPETFTYTP